MATPSVQELLARRLLLRAASGDRKIKLGIKGASGASVTVEVPRGQTFEADALALTASRVGAKGTAKVERDDGVVRNVSTVHNGKDAANAVRDVFAVGAVVTGRVSAETFDRETDDELRKLGINPTTDAAGDAGASAGTDATDATKTADATDATKATVTVA